MLLVGLCNKWKKLIPPFCYVLGLAVIVRLIFAGVIIFTYPIHFYVAINILWRNYIRWHFDATAENQTQTKKLRIYEVGMRTLLVVTTLLVTLLVKQLSFLISLVGSFCLPILGFLVPGLLELTINMSEKKTTLFSVTKDAFLIFLGLLFFSTGTILGISKVLNDK